MTLDIFFLFMWFTIMFSVFALAGYIAETFFPGAK